jgi:hypothetical protein
VIFALQQQVDRHPGQQTGDLEARAGVRAGAECADPSCRNQIDFAPGNASSTIEVFQAVRPAWRPRFGGIVISDCRGR